MAKIEIRPALKADTADILALIRAKAEFDGCLDSLRADEQALQAAFFSNPPQANALVAICDGKVVGIATYYDIYSTFIAKPGIWLDDLYVYEGYRQHGIGKALMIELCGLARRTGCGRIDWIVARDNENGRAFYGRLGAEVFERVRHARLDEAAIDRVAGQSALKL